MIKLGNLAFPPGEFDDITDIASSDRAARSFVSMFQRHIAIVRPNISNSSSHNNNNGNNNNNENENDENQRMEHYLEPTCPFVNRGYETTLANIMNQSPTDVKY